MNVVEIGTGDLRLRLFAPGTFYRGTRFDWAGVFDAVTWRGRDLAGRWFERYGPTMHDAVCGPAEEFTPVGFGEGDTFLKIGVGRLQADGAPYDRFKLYPVADAGGRSLEVTEDAVLFRHDMPEYVYEKTVRLLSDQAFTIQHHLDASTPLEGELYNHNFFTFGRFRVDPDRRLDFPFAPAGRWRAVYDSVGLTGGGLRFSRGLEAGESVYMGDLHAEGMDTTPYDLTLSDAQAGVSVRIRGDRPLTHTVFWANHRVACPEPYVAFRAASGEPFDLEISYFFQ